MVQNPFPSSKPKGWVLRLLPLLLICWTLTGLLVWYGHRPDPVWRQVLIVLVPGSFFCVLLASPYVDFLTKREIRRYCRLHGLTLVRIKVTKRTYGVTYLRGNEEQKGRWPDDFKP